MIWDPAGDGQVTREVSIKRTLVEMLIARQEGAPPFNALADYDSDEDMPHKKHTYSPETWIRPAGSSEALMGQDAASVMKVQALAEPSFTSITRVGATRPLFGAYPRNTMANKKAAEWGPMSGPQFVEFWHNTGTPARDGMMLPCVGMLSAKHQEDFPFKVRAMQPETGKYATMWFKPLALAAPGINEAMPKEEFEMSEKMVEMAVRKRQPLFLAWVPFGPLQPPSIDFVSARPIPNSPKAAEAWAEEQGNEAVRKMANEFGCPAAAKFVLEGWDALSPEEQDSVGNKDARELVELLRVEQAETAARCLATALDPVSELPLTSEPAKGVAKLEALARKVVAKQSFSAPLGADLAF